MRMSQVEPWIGRKVARVFIANQWLEKVFASGDWWGVRGNVPKGAELVGVCVSEEYQCTNFIFEHKSFPPLAPPNVIPILHCYLIEPHKLDPVVGRG